MSCGARHPRYKVGSRSRVPELLSQISHDRSASHRGSCRRRSSKSAWCLTMSRSCQERQGGRDAPTSVSASVAGLDRSAEGAWSSGPVPGHVRRPRRSRPRSSARAGYADANRVDPSKGRQRSEGSHLQLPRAFSWCYGDFATGIGFLKAAVLRSIAFARLKLAASK
jgi:hypothetical protein